jgi:hypothetical protein
MVHFWRTLKGKLMVTYPYAIFINRDRHWRFSYNRYNLVLSHDTTTPYSILRFGPYEFFIRPKSREMDWF